MASKKVSRRDFFADSGKVAAGAAAMAGGLSLASCGGNQTGKTSRPAWPWPYEKLDPEEIRKKAHQLYYVDS